MLSSFTFRGRTVRLDTRLDIGKITDVCVD